MTHRRPWFDEVGRRALLRIDARRSGLTTYSDRLAAYYARWGQETP